MPLLNNYIFSIPDESGYADICRIPQGFLEEWGGFFYC